MTPAISPALVFDRIQENRRKTALLLAIAIAAVAPFVVGVSFGVAAVLAPVRHARPLRYVPKVDDPDLQQQIDRIAREGNRRMQEEVDRVNAQNSAMRLRIAGLVGAGLVGMLGLLFWGLTSSPTTTVLSLCGARPPGPHEGESKHMLDGLAAAAGLPPPKLFLIDSMSPNAFSAGMDPEWSVVAVTQGLVALAEPRELEAVFAHELSHIGNRDTRLNTIVAAIALFLRLPYLLRQRRLRAQELGTGYSPLRRFRFYSLALSPFYIYVFCIAPLLAALIRSAISRDREFLADADAARLAGNSDGLMRILAKIRGAGSTITASNPMVAHLYFADPAKVNAGTGLFTGSLVATHPPVDERIARLAAMQGRVSLPEVEEALHAGEKFKDDHPPLVGVGLPESAQDELSALTAGHPMGRVFRVMGTEPAVVYDRDDLKSQVLARIPAGGLVVVFDDPGVFRQVLTHDQTFGYLPRSVKLRRVDAMPEEVFDPALRAAAEARATAALEMAPQPAPALTGRQITIAAVFGFVVFAGVLLYLMKFGGS
ncbi:MAG TPA: M48 family metalloprotease [Bryobacteraceae bacterium]